MKKIAFSLLLCVAFSFMGHAQLRKIPSDVTDAFKAKFPNAAEVEWKDKLLFFEVNFKDGKTDMTADFNTKGEWQETEKAMTFAEAPAAIKDGLSKSKYASPDEWKPGEVVTEITKNDKSVQYRVYVDKVGGIQKKYLYFSPAGRLEREAYTL